MSKFARLRLLVKVVIKHLKINAYIYLKLLGALSEENYPEVIFWLKLLALRIFLGAIQTYLSHQRRKQLDEKKKQ